MSYIIVGTHTFYGPTEREIIVHQVLDGTEIKFFPTLAAAQSMIDELDAGPYYLLHNESGRPVYRVEPATYEHAMRE